ncbi:uncharacterized protein LOC131428812 [Malaya genurostris]|uniref:uncharacterized protein LOC131428812 n=1 Tax=Malaya genurostris TaxID=325434 RepID=UPI0026F381BF|nr:uncharacterized protein LOC131428812 [Malaya genurostris]
MEELNKKFTHLQGLPIGTYYHAVPRILIGLDHASLGYALKGREGAINEPVAVKTRLGWTVYGSSNQNPSTYQFVNHHSTRVRQCDCKTDEDLHNSMKEYFSLDSMGVVKPATCLLPSAERRAQDILNKTTRRIDGQYEVGLLWKYDNVRLPDSQAMAMRRWKCLQQRLTKDEELASVLDEKFQDYLQKQYIRKLSPEELSAHRPRSWYLPIFPVMNPNKPNKVRLVWDAAAKAHGVSLNSVLLTGPDLLTPLFTVLNKFREFRVGITGDIREMYHQVLIRDVDQHCQRFLWRADKKDIEPSVFVLRVMTFGACCSPSSAQHVKNLNAMQYEQQYPVAVDAIVRRHYVDDMLTSLETEDEAIQLARDVKWIHDKGGFEIRNWISNSSRVLDALREGVTEQKSLRLGSETATEKVLGMYWCTTSDTFTYRLSTQHDSELLMGVRPPTKREALRTLMRVYDPLGLIGHVLIYLKVLMQEVWRSRTGWDDPIDENSYRKWLTWIKILPLVQEVQVPRCFRSRIVLSSSTNIQLHTFVDASESGFAATVFLRFEEADIVECSLIGAKTRVAPLKFLSIPKSELQSAVLGVRWAASMHKSLTMNISKRFFWTDSRNLLCWLHSDHRRYNQFVAFRISEILEATDVNEWRWVPTKHNVADDGTKCHREPDISTNSRWFKGPKFLYRPAAEWPKMPFDLGTTSEELRLHLMLHCKTPEPIIIIENFSSWVRLYRTTAFVLRAIDVFKALGTGKMVSRKQRSYQPLQQAELERAQNYLYRQAQMTAYPDEYTLLNTSLKPQIQLPKTSKLFRESPYMDDNKVMRIHGRINRCLHTDLQSRNPIILPPDHVITRIIAQHYHCSLLHRNHETALNKLRLIYYIPRLRAIYRKLRGNCQRCKIDSAIPRPPSMGDLPEARLATFTRPFSYVGVDYFGPMLTSVGRRTEKRWGVLITCLTVRAIHIELAHSLSTDSCIMALRCFMARRGVPITIYSDQGTNFRGASKELSSELEKMDRNKLIEGIVSPQTAWKFIPPASPHMGGAWERMIYTVKKNLQQMRLARLPNDEVLRNALAEIENTVNSRPLTHVPVDDEMASVLTPNHFLLGSSDGMKPLADFNDSGLVLRRNWQMSQTLANIFWRRWLSDYLPTLTRRTKWFNPVKPIAVDDLVVIVDPQAPRNTWPKGRVVDVSHSKDGQVRWASIQTTGGILERPAVKLAVLDVGVHNSKAPVTLRPTPGGSVDSATSSYMRLGKHTSRQHRDCGLTRATTGNNDIRRMQGTKVDGRNVYRTLV